MPHDWNELIADLLATLREAEQYLQRRPAVDPAREQLLERVQAWQDEVGAARASRRSRVRLTVAPEREPAFEDITSALAGARKRISLLGESKSQEEVLSAFGRFGGVVTYFLVAGPHGPGQGPPGGRPSGRGTGARGPGPGSPGSRPSGRDRRA